MRPLLNFTAHLQCERAIELASKYGFLLDPTPALPHLTPPAAFGVEVDALVTLLCAARAAGDAILLGGHAGLWVAATIAALKNGNTLPAMYSFDVTLARDGEARLMFMPTRLVEVHPARDI